MATIPGALRRIRSARRAEAPPQTKHYAEYNPAYRGIFAELQNTGGDAALSELTAWITDRIHETGHLPDPSAVRRRARAIDTRRAKPDSAERHGSVDDGPAPNSERRALSAEELLAECDLFEPYTTDELADKLDAPPGLVRSLLSRLRGSGAMRTKELTLGPTVWIREPPVDSCSECGYRFEVKFVHPTLSSAQFCPRCGTQL